jgi:hypothetical protein
MITMSINWTDFLCRLKEYPKGTHRILPPCTEDRIQAIQAEFGPMPNELLSMLAHFNGAKLFKKTLPLISIFGISSLPPLSPLAWSPQWHIDKYTQEWRSTGRDRREWAIAINNYGVLSLLESNNMVKEWDTGRAAWTGEILNFTEWLAVLFEEGDKYLAET